MGTKDKGITIIARVREAYSRWPSLGGAALGRRLGLSKDQVHSALHAIRRPELKHQVSLRSRRKRGMRPDAIARAARRAESIARAKPVLKLKRPDRSFSDVGGLLGITRNAVAGRIWRARQRLEGADAQIDH